MVASARARGRVWLAGIGVLGMTAPAAAQQHDPFYWLGEMNKASVVMVVERGIVPPALGGKIADTIRQVLSDGERPGAIRSGNYLIVEEALIKIGGPEVTRLHSGRSRQDIGATMQRLAMREDLLTAFDKLNAARAALLAIAQKSPNAIVPAYTWGVQAQPITLGHYLGAYASAFERDAERVRQAYARLNLSPLGAAALGTSSFAVDRPRLAELLGFDGSGRELARRQPDFADRQRRGGCRRRERERAYDRHVHRRRHPAICTDQTLVPAGRRRADRHQQHHAAEAQPVGPGVSARAGEHRDRSRPDIRF